MRYIELMTTSGEKVFLAVNGILAIQGYPGNVRAVIHCVGGRDYAVANCYDDIIAKIIESWGVKDSGKNTSN